MSNLNNKTALINMLLGSSLGSSLYCFLARTTVWPDGDTPPKDEEDRPASPQSDFQDEYIYFKMLDTRNIRAIVSGKVWEQDEDYEIDDFVKTPQNRIYRCSKDGKSTKIPGHSKGVNPEPQGEAEWEYISFMADIDQFAVQDFDDYLPLGMETEHLFYKPYIKGFLVFFEIVGNEENNLSSTVEYRTAGLYLSPNTNKIKIKVDPTNIGEITKTGTPLVWTAFKGMTPSDESIKMNKFFIGFE